MLLSADYTSSVNRHVFRAIPKKSKCLDVGCWTGNLGRLLIDEKECEVDGVDAGESVLVQAKAGGYKNVYKINLNGEHLDAGIIANSYDVIIFADVLEHLINPVQTIRWFSAHLKEGGMMVISLPNVAFVLNRFRLLFGKWEYQDFGTLDKTHLRFYTLASAKKMVAEAGLDLVSSHPYNQFGILRYLDPPPLPGLFAYQLLLMARTPSKKK